MKKLSPKGMKLLKVFHLFFAILWIGSAVSLNLLRILVSVEDGSGMYWMAEILDAIDMKILVPGAIGCLITGLIYSIFTNWGFFKFKWLTVKWILTIFMISLGTFYMGPLMSANVEIGKAIMEGRSDVTQYWHNVTCNYYCGILQVCLLTFVLIISVYKPWMKKRSNSKH